mmetsp:Transcript_9746/g.13331  ORF Transcript_9746/g.13331 Transcript_9746/m.13331 type:complete len:123 (+) Transcript_9746:31-399(+)|eukprot:Macronucleus_8215.p1 GENE.Macronucleus_8215~~Macronucleus_8215.p1  ORF type:complete len:123 (+),score=64.76 Macronucleus_8215:1-369(+)
MASVAVDSLSKDAKDQLVCTYAALLLHDGELEITEDKLSKVIKASGNAVEGYWPGLFVRALKGANIGDILSNVGSAAAAPAGGDAGAAAGGETAAEKKEEKKDEPEEDVDMGDLFGGGDDDY